MKTKQIPMQNLSSFDLLSELENPESTLSEALISPQEITTPSTYHGTDAFLLQAQEVDALLSLESTYETPTPVVTQIETLAKPQLLATSLPTTSPTLV